MGACVCEGTGTQEERERKKERDLTRPRAEGVHVGEREWCELAVPVQSPDAKSEESYNGQTRAHTLTSATRTGKDAQAQFELAVM